MDFLKDKKRKYLTPPKKQVQLPAESNVGYSEFLKILKASGREPSREDAIFIFKVVAQEPGRSLLTQTEVDFAKVIWRTYLREEDALQQLFDAVSVESQVIHIEDFEFLVSNIYQYPPHSSLIKQTFQEADVTRTSNLSKIETLWAIKTLQKRNGSRLR